MRDLFRVLAVVGVLNAAIGAYYYVRVIMALFLRSSLNPPVPAARWNPVQVTAVVCAAVTVLFGVYPGPLLLACARAIDALRGAGY